MSRERRRLFLEEETTAEPGRFGCPMLVRSRTSPSGRVVGVAMRCSLGWALHDELEAARCRATDGVIDCWKMHPERTPLIAVPGSDLGAAQDAETTSIVLAAD